MSLIGLNVVYGGDTNFTTQVPASDAKTRWYETNHFKSMQSNPDGSGGTIIDYNDGTSPYSVEIRVTQSPFQIAPSDIN